MSTTPPYVTMRIALSRSARPHLVQKWAISLRVGLAVTRAPIPIVLEAATRRAIQGEGQGREIVTVLRERPRGATPVGPKVKPPAGPSVPTEVSFSDDPANARTAMERGRDPSSPGRPRSVSLFFQERTARTSAPPGESGERTIRACRAEGTVPQH